MTTEQSNPARYVTLQDYLRVLRRYWMLIATIALVGATAGLVDTLRQTPSYQATAQVSFQAPTQDQSLVGLGATPVQAPAQLAAVAGDTATTPGVLNAAYRRLHTPAGDAGGTISTQVDPASGLLTITANASTPVFASRLANAVATVLVGEENGQTRARFGRLARSLQGRIAGITHHQAGSSPGQLGFYEDELARVSTLAGFASIAQIANVAEPPAAPSAPSRFRSAALGLLLGLLLGIAVAFVRDSTDRRLRSLADIKDSFPQPVLGQVHSKSMGRIVQVAGGAGGADGFDREAFRILRRNLQSLEAQQAPHVILVTSSVAQEGKSTVAGSLAVAMAAAGKRTVLVDCDLRKPSLAGRLNVSSSPGLSEYLSGSAEWQDILTTVEVATPPSRHHNGASSETASTNGGGSESSNGTTSGSTSLTTVLAAHDLVFVPAGSPSHRSAELLGSPRFHGFLDAVGHTYDTVILDSTPLLPVSDTLEILPHADAVIICARASQTTREQASALQAALAHYPQRPTGLVVTGIKPGDSDYADYAYDYD